MLKMIFVDDDTLGATAQTWWESEIERAGDGMSDEAVWRRPADARETRLRIGDLELDRIERKARRRDRKIQLLPREYLLLDYLMRRGGDLVTRPALFREVFNYRFVPHTNLVDVHIGRLRRKLHAPGEPPIIHTIRGAGFVLSTRRPASAFARERSRR